MSKNVETIENVIEDESHFITKVVDNDLGALAMFAKHFIGGGVLVVLGGRSSNESKSACREVGRVEKTSSRRSKLMVKGEECLEGSVRADGGEVSGGRDDFGVSKSLLGEILGVVIGEGGGEIFGDDGGTVCLVIMSKNVETIENVIEDESHFITKVVDNDLGALAMFVKHFIGEHKKGLLSPRGGRCSGGGVLVVLGGRSSKESKSVCREVGGVEKMSSRRSKLMVKGEECLEGSVRADGGEVSGGRDDFGVSKSLLGEILGVVIGEGGGEIFGDDGGTVW
uniref:Uncharacterized protein n=1 Tax=Tanacetum cinerariifolium TaxID=118510 RepID=A0A6L2NT08_TANCI|nr:hypothetical protein [Tanacetum cinerariifolium]